MEDRSVDDAIPSSPTGASQLVTGQSKEAKPRLWMLIAFVLCLSCLDIASFWTRQQTMVGLIEASLIAKVIFLAIMGGLLGRNWLTGLFWASVWGIWFVGLTVVYSNVRTGTGFLFAPTELGWDGLWFVFFVPLCVFFLASSFLFGRAVFGLRLALRNEAPTLRGTMGIEELLLLTASVAAILSLVEVPAKAISTSMNANVLSLFVVAAILGGVFGYPLLFVGFLIRSPVKRFIGYALAMGLGLFFVIGASYLRRSSAQYDLTVVLVTVPLLLSFFEIMRLAGFRLVRSESKAEYASRLARNEFQGTIRADRVRHRIQSAGLLIFVVLAYASAGIRDRWRLETDAELADLAKVVQSQGGSLMVQNQKVTMLKFATDTTDSMVGDYLRFRHVQELDVSGTQVTDDIVLIAAQFPELNSLDLSSTQISDDAIVSITSSLSLLHLSVAGTSVSKNLLGNLTTQIPSVDLGSLDLTDDDMKNIALQESSFLRSLSLKGNRGITDAWLNSLGSVAYFKTLDLSETGVNGSAFPAAFGVGTLKLDDCPVSDASLTPNLNSIGVSRDLSLARTLLTDAILQPLLDAASIQGFSLGEGNFSEAGLSSLKGGTKMKVGLNGKQFTGRCFEEWHPQIRYLDMSGSSVSDETISHLQNVKQLLSLRLSQTAITDKGLQELKHPILRHVDVSHTNVTVEGILQLPAGVRTIVVSPGQFGAADLKRLRSRFLVEFISGFMW